jgi:integrase
MSVETRVKPAKPYPDFPLTAHPNGQWAKKIKGKLFYFGAWADWEAAETRYQESKSDLQAGRTPRPRAETSELRDALNLFLSSKDADREMGDISQRSYAEYERTCDKVADAIGKTTSLAEIDETTLKRLRVALSRGERKKELSPTTLRNDLTRARMFFLFVNETYKLAIPYRKPLRAPRRSEFRRLANERGPRMFSREEIQAIVEAAPDQLKAMILLGINCGFGNNDCGTLPIAKIDLEAGWHTYWRPKTHNERRCPLWPETIAAVRNVLEKRPKRIKPEAVGLVFVTRYGHSWADTGDLNNPVSYEFRKLLKDLGFYRRHVTSFYNLRRTFETIGQASGDQVAVNYVMGHIPTANDMASIYRQRVFDQQLVKVTGFVRDWYLGNLNIA